MTRLTPDILEGYLGAYGWKVERTSATSWKAGWSGESRFFPLVINLTDAHVSFTVNPLLDSDIKWEEWPDLMRFIMDLNRDLKFFKVSVDAKDSVILSGEVLSQGFEYDNLSDLLGILGYYADVVSDSIGVKMQEYRPTFQAIAIS